MREKCSLLVAPGTITTLEEYMMVAASFGVSAPSALLLGGAGPPITSAQHVR
jgi:hypothetical protein